MSDELFNKCLDQYDPYGRNLDPYHKFIGYSIPELKDELSVILSNIIDTYLAGLLVANG